MPFHLQPACHQLRQTHAHALSYRRTLLDLAFTSGGTVQEQAVALEHGDALLVRVQREGHGLTRNFVVVDLDPPGRTRLWPEQLESLGGPLLAQTWGVALHALLGQENLAWQLLYVRGPALGTSAYLETLNLENPVQLLPCARVPLLLPAQDLLALTLTRAENLWRLPSCDWLATLQVEDVNPLALLRAWLGRQTLPWTLHDVEMPHPGQLTATLRAQKPLEPPPGIEVKVHKDLQRLGFPVNDALLAWPLDWLPQPLAVQTLANGLWLAGLHPRLADEVELPEMLPNLRAEWQVEALTRETPNPVLVAVTAAEAASPVPAGLTGEVWRLPGHGEELLAARGMTGRLAV